MTECCLLLICCAPEKRHAIAVEHYIKMGFDHAASSKLADDTLAMIDKIVALSPAKIAAMAHGADYKG